jgi:hypothetical protein
VIQLYAFTLGLRELPEVDGVALEARELGPVTAVVGDTADALHHGLVVEALLDCAESVLPVRFGERFGDAAALAAAVAPRLRTLERALAALAGCVEIGVRVLREDDGVPEAADGASYMRARAESEAAIAGLHRTLRDRAKDSVASGPLRLRHDTGYLVRRGDVSAFAREVDRYAAAHPELTLLCTGPWAPYSFAATA